MSAAVLASVEGTHRNVVSVAENGIIDAAPQKLRVVCGGWKKLPVALKPLLNLRFDVEIDGEGG